MILAGMDKIPVTTVSLIILGSMALLIRIGVALHSCGLSRSKNAASSAIRSVVEMAVAILAFWALGGAIMSSTGGAAFGFSRRLLFFLYGDDGGFLHIELFFNIVLVLIAVGPLAAAMGERSRMLPIVAGTMLLAAIVVPICGYWTWINTGWLNRLGFIDAGGASVLHLTGGLVALIAAIAVGPRLGKYNTDGSSNLIPGHSVPQAASGILLMAAGWIPYIVGASLLHLSNGIHAATSVLLAGAAATVVSYGLSRSRYGKPDILLTLGGFLGGLVAISAGAPVVSPIGAVAIGAVAGLLVNWATVYVDLALKIDDPSGTLVAHILGGAWGTIAAGIFMPLNSWHARLAAVGIQGIGLAAMAVLALVLGGALYAILKSTTQLRVSEADEFDGLDLAEHDLNGYPDFQQTMIKSYHLREA